MKQIVVFREPKIKPLPPSITKEKMQAAQLPARLERVKQALAECYDLSELLMWKDQAAAICAAAKAAKMPDIAKGANRVCKEALLRLGQLLSRYSSVQSGRTKSDRRKAIDAAGTNPEVAKTAVRLATTPKQIREAVLSDDSITANYARIGQVLARRDPRGSNGGVVRSDAYVKVMSGSTIASSHGLTTAVSSLRNIDLAFVRALEPDEKKMVRAKVTEAMELLDAIEEALNTGPVHVQAAADERIYPGCGEWNKRGR